MSRHRSYQVIAGLCNNTEYSPQPGPSSAYSLRNSFERKKSRNPNPKWPQIFSRRSRWWEAVLPPCKRKTVLVKKGGRWNIKARQSTSWIKDHNRSRDSRYMFFTCFAILVSDSTMVQNAGKTYRAVPWYDCTDGAPMAAKTIKRL